ncbi:MAG: hypothetical protein GC155_02905 [Alphaproteobacteria bacterium]|nr:hypothetical protein [Alphaproteobacteria bacterium]
MTESGRFETAEDRTLYWTASFYIAPPKFPQDVQAALATGLAVPIDDAASLRSIQAGHAPSLKLSEAIEPLFNDISDRERLGRVDDYLLAVGDGDPWLDTGIETPAVISWETEGVRFEASPGAIGPQPTRVRRFWYVHKNGAVSWHVSFRVNYEHSPAHFYFLSMLQKALSPKEFLPADGHRIRPSLKVHAPPPEGTGIAPLDEVRIGGRPFWVAMAAWFAEDAPILLDRLIRSDDWRKKNADLLADPFGALIEREPLLETPGLMMPRARYTFFFKDREFFRRLLPPIDPATSRPVPRAAMVQEPCYQPLLAQIELRQQANEELVHLDAGYWTWITTRPDYQAARLANPTAMEARRKTIPAWEDDARPDCLIYLFLSGFNQNIIDFMNQDASEILDSIDPIYPSNENQETERFFVRFASARALTSYVRTSRSLETGNDYIGMCPYAFLIHVLALHNEFLARDYEAATHRLIDTVERLNDARRLNRAAEAFYAFRTGAFAAYFEDRYENVFRYDTEADVFAAVEQRRGTQRKTEYLDAVVGNLERQTEDLQARIQKREDRAITYAIGAVGAFGLFALSLQIDDMLPGELGEALKWPLIWIAVVGSAIVISIVAIVAGGDLVREFGELFAPRVETETPRLRSKARRKPS